MLLKLVVVRGLLITSIAAEKIIFQKRDFATYIVFIICHVSFSPAFLPSPAFKPLVPQKISSILHKAKVLSKFI